MRETAIAFIFAGDNAVRLLEGLSVTLSIAAASMLAAAPLGLAVGLAMIWPSRILRTLSLLYLETARIVPLLVWLFVFYFGLSGAFDLHFSAPAAAVLVFALWGAAELGDIVRGAATSLPKHQTESALALGLSERQIFRRVILPQAARRIAPGAINLATRMIKSTSLVVLIGAAELLTVGRQIIEVSLLNAPTASFWMYGLIFLLYFILCYPISLWSKRLEKRWQTN